MSPLCRYALPLCALAIDVFAETACDVGYVGVRIVHSLVHALVNKIMVRFGLFALSSAVLAGLTAKAAQVIFL